MSSARLERLALDDADWLEHVSSRRDAMPFHHPAWAGFLADCYGLHAEVLGIVRDGGLVGGLPLLRPRLGRGSRLVSLPFTDYCPPLADDPAELAQLLEAERRSRSIRSIEIRAPLEGVSAVPVGYRHVLPLRRDPEAVRERFHQKRVRQVLRKIEREGSVEIRRAQTVHDLTETFYGLHEATRRRLGVPVQPRRFFRLLWERMLARDLGWCLLAYAGGTPIGGAVFLAFQESVVYKFSAADRAASRLRPANLLLWHAIQESCLRGFSQLDMGRTDPWTEGLREFKLGWGAREEPLEYATLAHRAPTARRESPGRASQALGSLIRRSPPVVCRTAGELLYRYAA
jgi:CelD/BcsL family acetyltransferase involved in cellulose biosynthesis